MPGAERLRDSAPLMQLVAAQREAGGLYAAICATPAVALEPKGVCAVLLLCHPDLLRKLGQAAVHCDARPPPPPTPAPILARWLPHAPRSAGLLAGKRATAHPAFAAKLTNQAAVEQRVVVDGALVTSRGPGTAFEFALALVKALYGEGKMREVAGPMVMAPGYDAALGD